MRRCLPFHEAAECAVQWYVAGIAFSGEMAICEHSGVTPGPRPTPRVARPGSVFERLGWRRQDRLGSASPLVACYVLLQITKGLDEFRLMAGGGDQRLNVSLEPYRPGRAAKLKAARQFVQHCPERSERMDRFCKITERHWFHNVGVDAERVAAREIGFFA